MAIDYDAIKDGQMTSRASARPSAGPCCEAQTTT